MAYFQITHAEMEFSTAMPLQDSLVLLDTLRAQQGERTIFCEPRLETMAASIRKGLLTFLIHTMVSLLVVSRVYGNML